MPNLFVVLVVVEVSEASVAKEEWIFGHPLVICGDPLGHVDRTYHAKPKGHK